MTNALLVWVLPIMAILTVSLYESGQILGGIVLNALAVAICWRLADALCAADREQGHD